MSGHSKWATTKHKKAANDAKRGGGDPSANPTLDDMIKKAKKASVPNDNIERARKRGSGEEAGGADWETIMYEGYGPNGVAILIECLTDNRNRAATEVRTAMTKNGGNMAESGSVAYLFTRKGVVLVAKGELTEDDVLMAAPPCRSRSKLMVRAGFSESLMRWKTATTCKTCTPTWTLAMRLPRSWTSKAPV